ncbi:MAG TPA: glycogen debranching protein GlgX [Acidimicrobiales bacterium]
MTDARVPDPAARASLGATLLEGGTHFSVVSLAAESVELCLFDASGEESRVALEPDEGGEWHALVEDVGVGQRYGFRVAGAFDPAEGAWCDPRKLLLDPYARALEGCDAVDAGALSGADGDTAALVPRSIVVDDEFDWDDDDAVRPHHEWEDTVLYELHVRGATKRHPEVPRSLQGTYAGLATEPMIAHLTDLGVTTVELLPIHDFVAEGFLAARGLTNYWGYNSVGYFAPTSRYAVGGRHGHVGSQVQEFKAMVAALHRAGLEVVLDVVYNHTAESDERGPVLSFRGLDDAAYYRHDDEHHLVDTTGCGNSINAANPIALALVLDSLRYWAEVCHVDGFRFDLTPTLARPEGRFDPAAPFLQLCAQDPVLRGVKLIAEPWDVGQVDSYALGQFPVPFREWNGRFRDTVRDFWRSKEGTLAAFATRFAGSSDLFEHPGRAATSSINYVTSHDGFTLQDLVSYDEKHNDANGEENEDGTDDNRSWNCGVEGPSDDEGIVALRGRQARAMLATTVLSCGVPMLLGGDELGRTQRGNNNAYCQDNESSWLDWSAIDEGRLDFARRLIALRRSNRAFRRRRFLAGKAQDELGWFAPSGAPMTPADWDDPAARCVAIHLEGSAGSVVEPSDAQEPEDDFVVLVNGWWEPVALTVPDVGRVSFVEELDSFDPARGPAVHRPGDRLDVGARSVRVLRAASADAGADSG